MIILKAKIHTFSNLHVRAQPVCSQTVTISTWSAGHREIHSFNLQLDLPGITNALPTRPDEYDGVREKAWWWWWWFTAFLQRRLSVKITFKGAWHHGFCITVTKAEGCDVHNRHNRHGRAKQTTRAYHGCTQSQQRAVIDSLGSFRRATQRAVRFDGTAFSARCALQALSRMSDAAQPCIVVYM